MAQSKLVTEYTWKYCWGPNCIEVMLENIYLWIKLANIIHWHKHINVLQFLTAQSLNRQTLKGSDMLLLCTFGLSLGKKQRLVFIISIYYRGGIIDFRSQSNSLWIFSNVLRVQFIFLKTDFQIGFIKKKCKWMSQVIYS